MFECGGWMGVGCPCPPVRNNIVTPRHFFFVFLTINKRFSGQMLLGDASQSILFKTKESILCKVYSAAYQSNMYVFTASTVDTIKALADTNGPSRTRNWSTKGVFPVTTTNAFLPVDQNFSMNTYSIIHKFQLYS